MFDTVIRSQIYYNKMLCCRCPTYNNLPADCQMVKKAGECCAVAECKNGYYFSSSTKPSTIGNGGSIQVLNPPSGNLGFFLGGGVILCLFIRFFN